MYVHVHVEIVCFAPRSSDGKYSGKERLKSLTPGTEYEYHVQIRIVEKNNTHVYIPCSGETGKQIRTAGGCGWRTS